MMIIQLLYSIDRRDMFRGHNLFIHHKGNPPLDNKMEQIFADYWGFYDSDVRILRDYKTRIAELYCFDKLVGYVNQILCTYDKDGKIINPLFHPLNENKSMNYMAFDNIDM